MRPTDGNFEICFQAKKALLAILDTVLSPEQEQTLEGDGNPPELLDISDIDNFNDQTWLRNLDMNFWTSLEEHPLLAWAEPAEQSDDDIPSTISRLEAPAPVSWQPSDT